MLPAGNADADGARTSRGARQNCAKLNESQTRTLKRADRNDFARLRKPAARRESLRRVSLGRYRRPRAFRDFGHNLVKRFWFVLKCQVVLELRYRSHGSLCPGLDAPDLVFLHQAFTLRDIPSIAANCRVVSNKFLNPCGFCIQSMSNHSAAQSRSVITPTNERDLLVGNNRD
jgi:hypothetical protein